MRRGRVAQKHGSRIGAVAIAAVIGAAALGGCGDDDGESAQDRYCEAGDSLQASVAALVDLDLIAQGTDGLQSAWDEVKADVDELREAASDAAADEVAALEDALEEVDAALDELGGTISVDNVSSVATAVQGVGTATSDVVATLGDCP